MNLISKEQLRDMILSNEDLSDIDYSHIVDFSELFKNCEELESIPDMKTSHVINMDSMFYGCINLKGIGHMDTSNVVSMSNMFCGCNSLTQIPALDTSNVLNMTNMFTASGLNIASGINTSNAIDMSFMFSDCLNLLEAGPFDTSSAKDLGGLFIRCLSLEKVELINVSNCTSMSFMFSPIKHPIVGNFNDWVLNKNVELWEFVKTSFFIDMFGYESTVSSLFNFGRINEFELKSVLLNKDKHESIVFLENILYDKMYGKG